MPNSDERTVLLFVCALFLQADTRPCVVKCEAVWLGVWGWLCVCCVKAALSDNFAINTKQVNKDKSTVSATLQLPLSALSATLHLRLV